MTTPQGAPAPAMSRRRFEPGMTTLSGALDHYRPLSDQQAAVRIEAYYQALKHVQPDVWEQAVVLVTG